MAQSDARSVDEWFETVDPARRDALAQLRALCLKRLSGWGERMQWGMPGYGPSAADAVVSFNSQKNHIAFYVGATALDRFANRLGGIDRGKGCLRYRRPEQIDFAVLDAMLDDIYARCGPTI